MGDPVGYINALIILDNEGNRIIAKYYNEEFESIESQKKIETKLFQKSNKLSILKQPDSEILNIDSHTCVFKFYLDIGIFILGKANDNEVALASVLDVIHQCLEVVLKQGIERKFMINNMSSVLLIIDEIVENGIIMSLETEDILSRLDLKKTKRLTEGFKFGEVY